MLSKQKTSLRSGSQKHHPDPRKQGKFCPKWKLRWLWFFDCEGVIHHEFLLRCQTVNEECYLKVMKRLREAVRSERPDLWNRKKMAAPSWWHSGAFLPTDPWFSHKTRDDSRPPASVFTRPHTSGLFLFTQLISLLKGRWFESIQEIKGNSPEELRNIPQEAFQECLQNCKKRWE